MGDYDCLDKRSTLIRHVVGLDEIEMYSLEHPVELYESSLLVT